MDQYKFGDVVMSSITSAGLELGVFCAEDPIVAKEQLEILIKVAPVVPFDTAAVTTYGPIRLATKERKQDMMDKLIAAHAVALRPTLVTNNVNDFSVYPTIKIKNLG